MNDPTLPQDRRQSRRFRVSFIVTYHVHKPLEVIMIVGSREINAVMLDLSSGGMSFFTNYPIPVQSILIIRFTLINPYVPVEDRIHTMHMNGEVRHCTELEKGEFRLGVCFHEVSDSDKQIIERFVEQAFRHKPNP